MQSKVILMEGEGLLPIVQAEDGRYTMDVAVGQFRGWDKPWVVYPFESCIGRQLLNMLGMDERDLVV